tara:strand:+ start:71 stop:2767 length:2697 start_codon:yes stop_codon:yes gene_type:complete
VADDITPEQIEQREKLLDLVRQGVRLSVEEKEQLKELLDLQGRRLGSLQEEAAALEGQIGKYAKLKDSEDKRVLLAQASRDLAQRKLDIAKQELANAEEIDDKLQEQFDTAVKNLQTAEKALEVAKGTTDAIKQGVQAGKELGATFGSAFAQYGEHPLFNAKTIGNLGKVIRGLGDKNLKPLDALVGGMVGGSLAALAGSFFNLIFQVDEAQRAFIRATGASEEYAASLQSVYVETRFLGVEMKEVASSMQALYTTYTDFTMLSKAQRDELTKTGAVLAELGVSNEDFAKGLQLQTKMLGESTQSAAANSLELADLARVIGVTPQQMGKDFAAAGAGVAKLGAQGVKAFKDLAIVSKTTGLEINKLLAITDKFDTFEGAATQAGKLNAALGGNFVNAMDLMTATDPVERFSMIRDAILDTGLTFDEMSYYQRVFYKDALGLGDVSELALMLSGDMSTLAGSTQKTTAQYQKAAEEAKRVQSITEQFKAAMMDLIPVASSLLEEFRAYTAELTPGSAKMESLRGHVVAFTDALKVFAKVILFAADNWKKLIVVWGGLKLLSWMIKFKSMQSMFGGFFNKTVPESTMKSGKAVKGFSTDAAAAIGRVGSAAKKNAVGIGALSLAIVAIGGAVAIAAVGLARLVEAFGAIDKNAGAAVLAIGLVMGAFAGMIALLIPLAPVAGAAGTAMLPLAAVILAIGGAVFLAATGIGLMAEGLATMFGAMNVTKMVAFTAFVAVAGTLGLLLIPAALGLTMFSGALTWFGLQLRLFPTDELAPITAFLASLGLAGAVAGDLHKVALSIGEINSKLRELPKEHSAEFTTTMNAVTNATVATSTARAVTSAAAAASTARAATSAAVATPAAAAGSDRPYNVSLQLVLDGDVINEQFVKLLRGKLAEETL